MGRNRKITQSDIYQATRKILVQNGYAGFHFGLLAEELEVTRAALYKYFDHKDELISEFMNHDMEKFVDDLNMLKNKKIFDEKLDLLLQLISKNSKIHKVLSAAFQIQKMDHPVVRENLKKLHIYHKEMNESLYGFIRQGKEEKYIRNDLPDELILHFLLQTVNMPNRTDLPEKKWLWLMKSFLIDGFTPK